MSIERSAPTNILTPSYWKTHLTWMDEAVMGAQGE